MSGRARHAAGLAAILLAVLVLRRDAFLEQWSNPALDARIATGFVLIVPLACGVLILWDVVRRSVSSTEEDREVSSSERDGVTSSADRQGEGRPGRHGRSPYRVAMRRFAENRLAMGALYVIGGLCLVAILAPILAPFDPSAIDDPVATRHLPPSAHHLFGTDEYGRDWLSRALYGARVSLSVGILAVVVAVTFGTIYGAVAGYFGGFVDNALMRIVDVIMAFPTFFLMLMLVGVFEANLLVLVLILGFTSWTGTARFIRGEILSLKERDFIEAARAMGLPHRLIIFRHLIPNAMAPVLVSAALMVGGMIGAEAGLSFLGIGIRPPTPSWGNMVSQGQDAIFVAWWVALFPGLLLSITILSFNLLADGLRDALDPKTLMRKYV